MMDRILVEGKLTKKGTITNFVIFLDDSTEKYEVKAMELADKYASTPAQSWASRADGKYPPEADYYSEPKLGAILQAERNKDFKKDRLSSLPKEF
jgi:hypothetical protein